MNEPSSAPPSPPQFPSGVRTRKRWGCLPVGCLVVVVALVLCGAVVGGVYWLFSQGGEAFLSEQPFAVHVAEITDEQYQAVLAKLAPFDQAMNEGHAATLEITLDDLNVLIARSPQFQALRGRLFLTAKGSGIVADMSAPLTDSETNLSYFNGRATLDASYASNGFDVLLRHLEPLASAPGDTPFANFLNKPAVLNAVSQKMSIDLNEGFRERAAKDPVTAGFLRDLRTIVILNGKIVVTTNERPGTTPIETPAPTPTPVATGSNPT